MTTANLSRSVRELDQPKPSLLERDSFFLTMMVAHFVLGVAMEASTVIATLHAFITLGAGLYIVFAKRTQQNLLFYVAYVVGMEVVWRMTGAVIFWESGKYLASLVLILALLLEDRPKIPLVPVLFFLLLLPAMPELMTKSFVDARDDISFNYSGPFVMMIAMIYFARVRLDDERLMRMMKFLMTAILSASGSIILFVTVNGNQGFIDDSNPSWAGGFAPNQVTTILGLAMVLAFALAASNRHKRSMQTVLFALAGGFGVQAVLTFSRSGLLIALITVMVVALLLLRVQSARNTVIAIMLITPILVTSYLIPQLNEFSGGSLETRFTDVQATGRDVLIQADFYAWQQAPVFGVGVSFSRYYHDLFYVKAAQPHNEFTRILAEHGLIGVAGLGLLLTYVGLHGLKRRTPFQTAVILSLVLWGMLTLAINGFRLAAPGVMIAMVVLGTSELTVKAEDEP